ncbi:DUF2505 domain-containing protein [Sanguibacter antarcticus]|uniref:Uncharacterized protein DUF2505 n=1 Tax=Sanguibacter antarcticus TaxID=372484 RepID=A0A2A9E2P7_9MICO|nr:DUF2505 domain-containing protein [Sanguibacter antarcticus]PFG32482.1 uncharacterized protein DUF2505 [Sanguibacter antarcticus]
MRISVDLHFPVATDAVVRLVNDEDFIRYRAQRTGSRILQVDVTSGVDGSFTSAVRRTISSDLIPPHLRPVVGNELEIRQTEAWAEPHEGTQGDRYGTVAVDITGAPVRMTGSVVLTPAHDGSVMTYSGEIKSSLPLFGAAVEKAAAEAIERALVDEARCAASWIAAEGPSSHGDGQSAPRT